MTVGDGRSIIAYTVVDIASSQSPWVVWPAPIHTSRTPSEDEVYSIDHMSDNILSTSGVDIQHLDC